MSSSYRARKGLRGTEFFLAWGVFPFAWVTMGNDVLRDCAGREAANWKGRASMRRRTLAMFGFSGRWSASSSA